MDTLRINILNLTKQTKGILLHNGVHMVSDLTNQHQTNFENLQTDPDLSLD